MSRSETLHADAAWDWVAQRVGLGSGRGQALMLALYSVPPSPRRPRWRFLPPDLLTTGEIRRYCKAASFAFRHSSRPNYRWRREP